MGGDNALDGTLVFTDGLIESGGMEPIAFVEAGMMTVVFGNVDGTVAAWTLPTA
jgi:hypothetical protein